MLWHMMKCDWRNLSAERAPLMAALLLGAAIGYGAFNGSQWARFQEKTIAEALAEEHSRLEAIRTEIPKLDAGEKKVTAYADPRLPQSFGRNRGLRYAVMPPDPLASLAIGQSDVQPYYFRVSTNSKETFLNNDEIENPLHLLTGRFDLAFVFIYLFPLVILTFSYNLISAEREAGTLALTLSQPVSLRQVVIAKVALRGAFLLMLSLAVSLTAVVLPGIRMTGADTWMRLAVWAAVTTSYGAFWLVLAIAVNAAGRSSAANAMTLSGLWLLFVAVIPPVVNAAAKEMYPVPSRVDLIQAIRAAGSESTKKGSQLLARYLEDHPELAARSADSSAADYGTLLVALNDATERQVQPVLDRFDQQMRSQQMLADRLRYLSPAIVTQSAYLDLAGSGERRHRHFLAQVDEYHRQWRAFFVPRILRKQLLAVNDLGRLPTFVYQAEATSAVMSRMPSLFAGLLLPVLAVAVAALRRLRRYPVAG